MNLLTKELTTAAASILTTNGGGQHGHVGLIIDAAEYITFLHNGTKFIDPINPGPYLVTVSNDAVTHKREIAELKAKLENVNVAE